MTAKKPTATATGRCTQKYDHSDGRVVLVITPDPADPAGVYVQLPVEFDVAAAVPVGTEFKVTLTATGNAPAAAEPEDEPPVDLDLQARFQETLAAR